MKIRLSVIMVLLLFKHGGGVHWRYAIRPLSILNLTLGVMH